jgi:hypothetical protein
MLQIQLYTARLSLIYEHKNTDNTKFLSTFSNRSNSSFLFHPLTYASAKRKGSGGVGHPFSTTMPWRPFPLAAGVSGSCNASQQQSHESFDAEARKLVAMRLNSDAFHPYKIDVSRSIYCERVILHMMDTWHKKSVNVYQLLLSNSNSNNP